MGPYQMVYKHQGVYFSRPGSTPRINSTESPPYAQPTGTYPHELIAYGLTYSVSGALHGLTPPYYGHRDTCRCPCAGQDDHTLTPSWPDAFILARESVHYTSPSQGWGEVKIGGRPGTPKGVQGLHPGITLSGAHYVMPPLQLGIRGPPRRPHGVSVELKEASWATKKFPENEEASWAPKKFPENSAGITGNPW